MNVFVCFFFHFACCFDVMMDDDDLNWETWNISDGLVFEPNWDEAVTIDGCLIPMKYLLCRYLSSSR
jgi:hypothetical protein